MRLLVIREQAAHRMRPERRRCGPRQGAGGANAVANDTGRSVDSTKAVANLVAGLVLLQSPVSLPAEASQVSFLPATAVQVPVQQPIQAAFPQAVLTPVAGLFQEEERDPIDPFTLYGSTRSVTTVVDVVHRKRCLSPGSELQDTLCAWLRNC
eukprot:scaffold311857_cov21-Tisochrysis_lutea.AAC.1